MLLLWGGGVCSCFKMDDFGGKQPGGFPLFLETSIYLVVDRDPYNGEF